MDERDRDITVGIDERLKSERYFSLHEERNTTTLSDVLMTVMMCFVAGLICGRERVDPMTFFIMMNTGVVFGFDIIRWRLCI